MLKTTRKYRPPISQLRESAQMARKILVEKNIEKKDSIFKALAEDSDAPVLPGIHPYIPHRWVLDAARMAIMDITTDWAKKNKNEGEQEKIGPFFRFGIKRLEAEEKKWKDLSRKNQIEDSRNEPLSEIFSPVRKWQSAAALKQFIVDSFAVSVIVKSNDDVTSYLDWFINQWTPSLNKLWDKKRTSEQKKSLDRGK